MVLDLPLSCRVDSLELSQRDRDACFDWYERSELRALNNRQCAPVESVFSESERETFFLIRAFVTAHNTFYYPAESSVKTKAGTSLSLPDDYWISRMSITHGKVHILLGSTEHVTMDSVASDDGGTLWTDTENLIDDINVLHQIDRLYRQFNYHNRNYFKRLEKEAENDPSDS